MGKRLKMGLMVAALASGCWKHETSAPHTTVTMEARGQNTQSIPASRFGDGWSVQFQRFWLDPTFGLDEAPSPKGDDEGRLEGPEAYVYYGGEGLELTSAEPVPAFGGSVLSGRSRGWGMRLRQVPPGEDHAESTLEVAGEAQGPNDERVRFEWRFSTEMTFAHCVPQGENVLLLPSDGELHIDAVLDGSALFREPGEGEPLGFAELAAADSDADGTVTTAELRATALYGTLTARLAGLVAPGYQCEVSIDACQDRSLSAPSCDDSDLAEKDADGDGVKNCLDDDLDGDGSSNAADCDAYHSLESLTLCNGEDLHEKDADHDGLRNCEDADIDGDGFGNENDGRPYQSPYDVEAKENAK
jgi:hypothetical protein